MILKPSLLLAAFLAGAAVILGTYWVGYFNAASDYKKQIADGQAKFARRISAANANTRATAARLNTQVQQSEAKIDELGQKYREAQAKLDECPLSDDDMRQLWNGAANPRARPATRPRVRQAPRQAAAP